MRLLDELPRAPLLPKILRLVRLEKPPRLPDDVDSVELAPPLPLDDVVAPRLGLWRTMSFKLDDWMVISFSCSASFFFIFCNRDEDFSSDCKRLPRKLTTSSLMCLSSFSDLAKQVKIHRVFNFPTREKLVIYS